MLKNLVYFVFVILMAHNVKSNINDYWSTKKYYQPIFGKTMACDRFKVISWYLHLSLSPEPNDKLRYKQTLQLYDKV